jgi:poly-gamma-glutamate capsule biosynthesis protein CapA/YwtB (metallophosphatase superfamily)
VFCRGINWIISRDTQRESRPFFARKNAARAACPIGFHSRAARKLTRIGLGLTGLLFLTTQLPAQSPAANAAFRFALVGDSVIDRRISVYDEPGFLQMVGRIRGADASFTNFEMLVHNFEYPGAPVSGGTYMGAPPYVIDELKWAGFKLFGAANNHSFDFGTEGMLSNLRHLNDAGVVYAGIGENLARARAPGYLDTKKGRVALIACASTFSILSPAGEQRPDLKGRPGLNPLRFKTTYIVNPATLATLRTFTSGGDQTQLRFLGATFKAGDKPAVRTEPDPGDVKGIAAEIREARRQADWIMVSIHAHEGAPGDRELPAEFLVGFAHAAIDAGADLFVGHGPHVLRGIEIYKGKPIFYSLANFIFQNETISFQPQENYDSVNLPLTATPGEFFDARSGNDTRSFPADPEFWESVEAEAVFNARRELQEIDLYPITLGFGQSRTQRGRPLPASSRDGEKIITRLAKLSKAFGTTVSYEGNKGVVMVASGHTSGAR